MSCPDTNNGKDYTVVVACGDPGDIRVEIDGDPYDAEVTELGGGEVRVKVDGEDVTPVGAVIRVYCGTTEVACATVV